MLDAQIFEAIKSFEALDASKECYFGKNTLRYFVKSSFLLHRFIHFKAVNSQTANCSSAAQRQKLARS